MTAIISDSPPRPQNRMRRFIITVILVSVLLHLAIGVLSALWIVARYFSKPPATFVVQKTIVPPKRLEHRLDMVKVDAMAPAPTFNHKIQSLRPSKLALPELPKIALANPAVFDPKALMVEAPEGLIGLGSGAGTGTLFGSSSFQVNALVGRLYDLKKSVDGKKLAPDNLKDYGEKYSDILNRFVTDWDDRHLKPFYQAETQLYTRQLFIPLVQAKEAPKAFGAEKEIEPIYWAAHYKGDVIAPFTGKMRFAGQGDNILVVRFGEKVVLDANLDQPFKATRKVQRDVIGKTADPLRRPMVAGEWISVREGVKYPMEALLGEGGGLFSCYLLAQVEGATYEKQSDGVHPRLPIFQTALTDIPPYKEGKNSPEISGKVLPFGSPRTF